MRVQPRIKGLGRLAAAGIALAVVLAGCSDATPSQEVRSGDSSSGAGSSTQPAQPWEGSTASPVPTITAPGSTDSGATAGGAEPGQPGQVDPSPPAPGGNQPPAGDGNLPPRTHPDGRNPHPWGGPIVGADGRTLTFTYYAGVAPCSVFDSIVAEEGPTTVRVTIYERSGPEGIACIMLAQQKSATVTLDAPFGGRTLVDGAIA